MTNENMSRCGLAIMGNPHDRDALLVVRFIQGVPTHWMDARGMWTAFPEDNDELEALLVNLTENPNLLPFGMDDEAFGDDEV